MRRGRCWDCKRWGVPGQVPLSIRQPDEQRQPVMTDVKLCDLHGYNNPFPERNCDEYRAKAPRQREPMPIEERKRWLS